MYEDELTQVFCVPCARPLELRTDSDSRYYECPGCGARMA